VIIGNVSIFNEVEYKEQSRQLDQLARGDFQPIADELKKAFPRTTLPVRAIPFVQRYVTELSGVYSRPVVRRFRPTAMPTAMWQSLQAVYDASRIDRAMEAAEASLWTQNTAISVVIPDGIGRVKLLHIKPWQIERIEVDDAAKADDPRSWTLLEAMVPAGYVSGQVVSGRMRLTPTMATREIGGKAVGIYSTDGSHPFGRVPVVVAHRIAPDVGRPTPALNEAVLNLQVALSLQQADSELIVRHCAWPQKWIRNASIAQQVEELRHGPDKFLAMVKSGDPTQPGPELAIAQGHVPVAELVSFAEHQIRLYCSMLGLDPSNFMRSNTATTASARLFGAQDRAALRARLEPTLLQFERDLVLLVAETLSLRESMPFPRGLSVDVAWAVAEPSPDPQSEAQALALEIVNGTNSAADVVAKREGISRAAALAVVKRNLDEARELSGTVAPAVDGKPGEPVVDKPADLAMNGAQVASLVDVINQVAAGTLPASAARLVLAAAFPRRGGGRRHGCRCCVVHAGSAEGGTSTHDG
jgi:hypothetical protein